MAVFPTLSAKPSCTGWEEQLAFDPTIRSRSEGGYTKTRARYTRIPMQWQLKYRYLSAADKATLQTFERVTVLCGADSFTWTNPDDGSEKIVRFKEPSKYIPFNASGQNFWEVSIVLEEV
jgi:hypothetical protein